MKAISIIGIKLTFFGGGLVTGAVNETNLVIEPPY